MTDDINYVWCNTQPTIFNKTDFNITLDDLLSLTEMEEQALTENEVIYNNDELLRLNQFNIHKVSDNVTNGMRAFLKVSFSKDKYDLVGNSHNHLIDYNWLMKDRSTHRNIPQSQIKNS